MAKKKKKDNTPRRKRWNRKVRLENAKKWIQTFEGKNIIKGYAKWYAVDQQCALNELQMLGRTFSEKEKNKAKNSIKLKEEHKKRSKEKKERRKAEENWEYDSDETFAFIAGYTEGGIPYGVTYEEMETSEKRDRRPYYSTFFDNYEFKLISDEEQSDLTRFYKLTDDSVEPVENYEETEKEFLEMCTYFYELPGDELRDITRFYKLTGQDLLDIDEQLISENIAKMCLEYNIQDLLDEDWLLEDDFYEIFDEDFEEYS